MYSTMVGGKINLCSHYEKQYERASKNKTKQKIDLPCMLVC